LPRLSGKEAVKVFERMGFRRVRQRGSHVVMRRDFPDGARGCAIPMHRELKEGTLRGILKQAGLSAEEFLKWL
jgi:predicted RNA binding protein YcfA (HicA-like mRNA interferase family)